MRRFRGKWGTFKITWFRFWSEWLVVLRAKLGVSGASWVATEYRASVCPSLRPLARDRGAEWRTGEASARCGAPTARGFSRMWWRHLRDVCLLRGVCACSSLSAKGSPQEPNKLRTTPLIPTGSPLWYRIVSRLSVGPEKGALDWSGMARLDADTKKVQSRSRREAVCLVGELCRGE